MPIRRGEPPECLAMWGVKTTAMLSGNPGIPSLRSLFSGRPWVPGMEKDEHGNLKPEEIRSMDTARHNEAD